MHNPQNIDTQITYPNVNILSSNEKFQLLQQLICAVASEKYRFTTVTPLTHERFLKRSGGMANNITDIFGWNMPFKATLLPPLLLDLLSRADLLSNCGEYLKSKIRISSLDGDLFLHSSFPTDDANSVFFGPDTYRFVRFIKQTLNISQRQPNLRSHVNQVEFQHPLRILDVGCGSGAGGVAAIRALPKQQPYHLSLNDINPTALLYASACTQAAAIPATMLQGDFFDIKDVEFDLIVSNPPFISDTAGRVYRDGGSRLGLDLSVRIVKHAIQLLAPGGQLLLYTGVAMTDNESNPLLYELNLQSLSSKFIWSYEEIDPDIFGEELERIEYHSANRIAAVGLTITRIE